MKVVVTGGAGFIGANLCRTLRDIAAVHEVLAFDDLSTGRADNLAGTGAELVEATILDRDALRAACTGASAVVHLAARPSVPRSLLDPVATHRANATGTLMVLEAARGAGVKHVTVASSSSVYGNSSVARKHEGLASSPLSPYAASKLAGESYALAYQASFGLPVLALRFFNVFGPLQPAGHAYAAVIPAFISAALSCQPLSVNGDGHQTRDFTFVDTVSAVILEGLMRKVVAPTPVNLAFGTRTELLEVVSILGRIMEMDLSVVRQPPRVGDVQHSQADHEMLDRLFPGIAPVSLERGLIATVAWHRRLLATGQKT